MSRTFRAGLSGCTALRLVLAAGLVLASAAPAHAQQETAKPGESGTSDIVVTAQFRQQNLQDTPLAITAVTGEMLEARGQTSITDIGSNAPNVTLRQAPATYGPAVSAYIRGVGQRDTTFALEPGVGIYIDDVYMPTMHGSLLSLVDLDRVEILRGPQGTLAGQNSIGGSIKLYSKKPDGNGGGYLQATYGSYDRIELRGAANFTIVPDKLFARLSATGLHKDGYITRYDFACTHPGTAIPSNVTNSKSCKLGTEGGRSYAAARLALRWEPADGISLDLVGDLTKDDSEVGPTTLLYVGRSAVPGATNTTNGAGAAYLINGVPYGTATGSQFISYSPYGNYALDPFSKSPYISYENYTDIAPRDGTAPWSAPLKGAVDSWGVSANFNADLTDNLSLTSITAFRKFSGIYSSGDGSPFSATIQANQIFNRQFSQELRLSGKVADIVNFTLGGYYFHKRSENISRVTLPAFAFIEDNVIPSTTKAAFANFDIAATDRLSFGLGFRYTDSQKTFNYGRKGIPGSNIGGLAPIQVRALDGRVGTFKGDRFDYRAVVQYRWSDALMTYAQFSTGFKGGGVNPRPFTPDQAVPHTPETLKAYEIGFKSDLFDRKVRLNATAFWNHYSDILVTVSTCPPPLTPAPCALPLNAGKADVKGAEAELTVRPVVGLTIDASLAYLNFKYQSITAQAAGSGIGLEDHGQYIQPWQWSLGAQYEIGLGSAGSLTPRIDISFEDSFDRNSNNVDAATGGRDIFGHIASRTLINARLTYRSADSNWEIALEARNLTDKLYYTDVFDNRGSTNSIQGSPAEPRTWAVSVKRKF